MGRSCVGAPPGIAAAKIVPRMDALKFQGILV